MKTFLWLSIACGLLLTVCNPNDTVRKTISKHESSLNAYISAWNTGNVDTLDVFCDSNIVRYQSSNRTFGLDSLKELIKYYRTMLPDLRLTIDEGIYAYNYAILNFTASGTNTGTADFVPTGKSFTLTGIGLYRFRKGKLVEEHVEADCLKFFQQLGFKLTPPTK
jgi:predicted ester cyclase